MQYSYPVVARCVKYAVDTLGVPVIAKAIDQAIHDALASGKIKSLSAGKMGMGTREVGDMIAKLVS
jgi:3-isopropylmalate dehydrogenase